MVDYKTDKQKMMAQWWKSPLAEAVLKQEKSILQSLKAYFYGQCQLQIGVEQNCLPECSHNCQQKVMASSGSLQGKSTALPLKSYSLDTLLLSHELEFSDDPHQVLREAERVLVADGTLVLCYFNPWSLWGLRRLFSWQDTPPWQGHFYTQTRIKDWLALLNFEVIALEKYCYHPPIKSEKWFKRFSPFERWGKRLWPFFSGASILVATKRSIPLTPITKSWRSKQLFPTGALANTPLSREKKHE